MICIRKYSFNIKIVVCSGTAKISVLILKGLLFCGSKKSRTFQEWIGAIIHGKSLFTCLSAMKIEIKLQKFDRNHDMI